MGEAWVHLAAETEPNVRDSEMLGTLAQALHPERTWCWLCLESEFHGLPYTGSWECCSQNAKVEFMYR